MTRHNKVKAACSLALWQTDGYKVSLNLNAGLGKICFCTKARKQSDGLPGMMAENCSLDIFEQKRNKEENKCDLDAVINCNVDKKVRVN